MADRAMHHRRIHSLLLFQKLLSFREASSPFTLILDSLEQSGNPLIQEYISRAKAAKIPVVYVNYSASAPPPGADTVIKAQRKEPSALQREISVATSKNPKTLLILSSLYALASHPTLSLPPFLFSLLTPSTSLLALYHTDIPLPPPTAHSSPYAPSPLTLLQYLATTIFTTHSLAQVIARKCAAEKSLPEPVFGLAEGLGGVVVGFGANDPRGLVLEMEHRRKSGRGVEEWFFLPAPALAGASSVERGKERAILLEDHPLYSVPSREDTGLEGVGEGGSTFSLGLTEKQRMDREGVVLPYMDAQREGGGGGGRILYEMGVEDDFDEEEDEI